MNTHDTRCLSPDAQEALRFRVVLALRGGMRKSAAARTFGVSRTSIDRWRSLVELGNINSLRSKPRGRPKGTRLAPGFRRRCVSRYSKCLSLRELGVVRKECKRIFPSHPIGRVWQMQSL